MGDGDFRFVSLVELALQTAAMGLFCCQQILTVGG